VTEAPPGAAPTLRDHLVAGWSTAALRGGLAFGAVLALASGAAVLAALGPSSGPDALRLAALVPALVHRVPIDVGVVSVRVAYLLATAGAGWLLFVGGRAVARRTGGSLTARAVHGAKVAVPYALGCLVVSLAALGASAGALQSVVAAPGDALAPSVPGSLGWPLLLATICGASGGASTAPLATAAEGRARGILAGGWRMTWLAVLLGTAGFLVVMALHPAAVRAYVDAAFRRGPATGTLALTGTVLLLPNVGTGTASAAMGGGVDLEVLGASCTVVSYARIPEQIGTVAGPCGRLPLRLGSPAPGYFLFLLLPAAASAAGGWLGARRSGAATGREGAVLAGLSGVVFAGLFGLLSSAAGLTYAATGSVAVVLGEARAAVGPDPLLGFLVALAWGLAGGAAGGGMAARPRDRDGPG
jgi:hypothetical protein